MRVAPFGVEISFSNFKIWALNCADWRTINRNFLS